MGQQVDLAGDLAETAVLSTLNGSAEHVAAISCVDAELRKLPLPKHLPGIPAESDFAHPAELDLARIFSFYRVRWVYEPTTFHLEFDDSGRPTEQVTPDFYLPDHDIYVELTTMRQSLVTRKNRKIRRLKEAFPTLHVKLLYRKDYDRLVGSFLTPPTSFETQVPGKPIFTEKQIQQRISEMAGELLGNSAMQVEPAVAWNGAGRPAFPDHASNGNGYQPQRSNGADEGRLDQAAPVHLMGLGAGSKRFLGALEDSMNAAGASVASDWLSLTRYADASSDSRVKIGRRPRLPVAGQDVTLVADVISTGLSVAFVVEWLKRHDARRVQVCTLLDREEARILDVPIACAGFTASNDVLVGFGISYLNHFDELLHIAALKLPAKSRTRSPGPE